MAEPSLTDILLEIGKCRADVLGTREAVRGLNTRLTEHIDSDNRHFAALYGKIDDLQTSRDIAIGAGRSAGIRWGTAAGAVIVGLAQAAAALGLL